MEEMILPNLTRQEKAKLIKIYQKIENLDLENIAENTEIRCGYAHEVHTGVLKTEYRNIELLGLAILCNNRYSFFGGEAKLNRDSGEYEVKIWTD